MERASCKKLSITSVPRSCSLSYFFPMAFWENLTILNFLKKRNDLVKHFINFRVIRVWVSKVNGNGSDIMVSQTFDDLHRLSVSNLAKCTSDFEENTHYLKLSIPYVSIDFHCLYSFISIHLSIFC